MDTTIMAKSESNPDSHYNVNFRIDDSILRINCSCPAGSRGQLCKHKTSLIDGDCNMLFDIIQQKELSNIVAALDGSPFKMEYSKFIKRKMEIEEIKRRLNKELKDLKIDMSMKLQNGIAI